MLCLRERRKSREREREFVMRWGSMKCIGWSIEVDEKGIYTEICTDLKWRTSCIVSGMVLINGELKLYC